MRVGSVPYVNSVPLTHHLPAAGVEVVADVPSRLPALLEQGEVDAILVSSIEALRREGAAIADQVCIASRAAVESVRLFSKVPFHQIQTLALDQSSMTSNALAQILLAEEAGVRPEKFSLPPHLATMLDAADACILIGDLGMDADGTGLEVMDLGLAWRNLTGKPFVWATWTGGDRLTPELVGHLVDAKEESGCGTPLINPQELGLFAKLFYGRQIEEARRSRQGPIIDQAIEQSGWNREKVVRYLTETMSYTLDAEGLEALSLFGDLCVRHGVLPWVQKPRLVGPIFDWAVPSSDKN